MVSKFRNALLSLIITIILIIILIITLSSCEDIISGSYTPAITQIEESSWQDDYVYGGVIPDWSNGTSTFSLDSTTWVLNYYVVNNETFISSQEIRFLSYNTYKTLNDSIRYYTTYPIIGTNLISLSLFDLPAPISGNFNTYLLNSVLSDSTSSSTFRDLYSNQPIFIGSFSIH